MNVIPLLPASEEIPDQSLEINESERGHSWKVYPEAEATGEMRPHRLLTLGSLRTANNASDKRILSFQKVQSLREAGIGTV